MADLGTMTVKVNGDLTGLDNQLKKGGQSLKTFSKQSANSLAELTDKLKFFQDAAFGEKDLGKLSTYNKGIKDTQKEISALASVGTSSLGAIGKSATKAFSLLRVAAQILPGIGIGGILAFAVGPIIAYTEKLFGASDATKKLKKDQEDLAKTTKSIFESSAKEAAQAGALVAVLKNELETRERKNQALRDLAKINPEIFGQLKLEEGAVIGIDKAYQNFLANFKNVIAAKIIQAKLEKAIGVLLEAQGVTQDRKTQALLTGFEKINKAQSNSLRAQGGAQFADQIDKLQGSFNKIKTDKVRTASSDVEDLAKQLQELSKGVELKIDKEKVKKATTSAKQTIADVLAELRQNIKTLNIEEALFNDDKSKERASAFLGTIKTLVTKFKLDPNGELIKGLFDETKFAKAGVLFDKGLLKFSVDAKKRLQTLGTVAPVEIAVVPEIKSINSFTTQLNEGLISRLKQIKESVNINDSFEALTAQLSTAEAKIVAFSASVNGIVTSSFSNIVTSLADNIGKAISGKAGFGDIFAGIFQSLGSGLKTLGRYLVETGIKIKIAKSLLFKNPIAAIAAGAALIILGSAIETKLQKTPGFANGVNNFGGGVALVGERGPELVNLPRGADVIPNNQLGGRIGGGTNDVNVTGQFALRGSDLVAVVNKANQTISRNS